MTDFADAFNEADTSERQSYLGAGRHTVTVRSAEVLAGDEARPSWANKSLKFLLGNDEGITFLDVELDPLTFQDGELNTVALGIAKTNLVHMGCTFNNPGSVAEFGQQAEQWVLAGGAHGAEVEINITEKPSKNINPNTGEPYTDRRVYVNKLISAGLSGDMPVADLEPQVI